MAAIIPGVKSVAKNGSTPLKGDVTLSEGTNITLTQTGQDITITASGGGGSALFSMPSVAYQKVAYWANASSLSFASGLAYDASNMRLGVGVELPVSLLDLAGNDGSSNGTAAGIKLTNTASGGGSWYVRQGATGTNTPAGGLSFANNSNYWAVFDSAGKLGLGASVLNPNEQLTVDGRFAVGFTTGASNSSGYGKFYVNPTDNLAHYITPTGVDYAWDTNAGTIAGSGVANKLSFFATASTVSTATAISYDPVNMRLGIGTASAYHQFHLNPQGTGIPFVMGSNASANGSVLWTANDDNQFLGIFDQGNNRGYGFSRYLPAPQGTLATSTLGGYYAGLGIGGGTNQGTGQPIFGVLARDQSANGPGSTAFTVYDTNRVADFHGFYNDSTGKMGLGITDTGILSERLNINGRLMMSFMTGVSNVSGFGKLYTKPDSQLYWLKSDGTEYALTPPSAGGAGSVGGSGQANKMTFWTNASMLSSASVIYYDDANRRLGLGDYTPNERLTLGLGSRMAIAYSTGASQSSGYGKIYTNPTDNGLYYLNPTGTNYLLNQTWGFGTVGGTGTANRVMYWANTSAASSSSTFTWDAANNELTVQGLNFGNTRVTQERGVKSVTGNGDMVIRASTATDTSIYYDIRGAGAHIWEQRDAGDTTWTEIKRLTGAGLMGLGTTTPPEKVSVSGANARIAIGFTTGVSQSSGYGKLYVKPTDSNLYYMNPTGAEVQLTPEILGTGVANKMTFWATASSVSSASAVHYDATNGRVGIYTSTPTAAFHNASTEFLGGRTTAIQLDRGYLSTPTSTATWAVDLSTGSMQYTMLSAATVTVWLQNPFNGGEYTLITKQDATGGRFPFWPTNVVWAGGTTPTPTSGATYVDIYKLIFNSAASIYWAVPTLNFAK